MTMRKQPVLLIALLLLAITNLSAACASGSVKVPEGAHMLYFNAKW